MSASSTIFEYPIKRPYPWRYTALFIFVTSTFVLAGLVYCNLKTLDCEPTTLVSGGTYRTQNGMFPYTIESITSTETNDKNTTLVYEGSTIENCTITNMKISGDFQRSEVQVQTKINCTLPGRIVLTAGFNTVIDREGADSSEPHNQMAQKSIRLVNILESDVRSILLGLSASYGGTFLSCYFSVEWEDIGGHGSGGICDADKPTVKEIECLAVTFWNLSSVLWSAVLLDLGVNAPYNRLSNPELMRQTLQPNVDHLENLSHESSLRASGVKAILTNMTRYGLPLEYSSPVQFHAQYLCHGMTWKKPSNVVIDVAVATVSLFMAYWAVLNFVLRYLATRSSPHGNHCVCPGCNELPPHAFVSSDILELRSLSDGMAYKRVPTRPQSTPP
ncbi:hypothetical protein BDV93DRAFT_580809 [Ceratobasidium sp. AG-I]|nr:hypothetical protein BDV93DRAFT_580809 [Ceratobasidium sp. AG-I]